MRKRMTYHPEKQDYLPSTQEKTQTDEQTDRHTNVTSFPSARSWIARRREPLLPERSAEGAEGAGAVVPLLISVQSDFPEGTYQSPRRLKRRDSRC